MARGYGGNDVIWDVDGSVVDGNHIWLSSNDTIFGGDGDDLIFARLGADSINGGAGHDQLDYRYSHSAVVLDIGAGVGRGDENSASAGDRFVSTEHFLGSAYGDTFDLSTMTTTAPGVAVTINGGAGNDRFISAGDYSVLIGGAGNDTFVGGGYGAELFGGRTQLAEAIAYLREGDLLVVTKLDRLARSVRHLLDVLKAITDKSANLRIIGLGIDTGTPTGRLMLNMLGSIAEFERDIMLERQREGIAKAKAEGKYKGRKPTAQAKATQVVELHKAGTGATDIARQLGIGRASVYRILGSA